MPSASQAGSRHTASARPACYTHFQGGTYPPDEARAMTHIPRLTQALAQLLHAHRVAALGTLDAEVQPYVSMVPYAIEPSLACLVIHVSGLAAHSANMLAHPQVSLLVMQAETPGEPVHALPRVTLEATAQVLERDSADWLRCRDAYLKRFPDSEPMTQLGDFMFMALHPSGARQIAGFGSARTVQPVDVHLALSQVPAETSAETSP